MRPLLARPLTLAVAQQASVGTSKAACAAAAIAARNPGVAVRALPGVTPETAVQVLGDYDLVLDCTDTPASRYMLSDAAVCACIPLVSGASIGMEGQVTVLCRSSASAPPAAAPCYRCLYPAPPAPGHCATCAEAGVLGPVPGVIGTLQAVEAIKVLCGIGAPLAGALLCYDALSGDAPFYTVQLPPRRQDCAACGAGQQSLRARSAAGGDVVPGLTGDLALPPQTAPLGSAVPEPPVLPVTWPRLTVDTYAAMRREEGLSSHILIDVRPAHLFQAACLQGATNVPFRAGDCPDGLIATVVALRAGDAWKTLVLICRAGNSSAAAADALVRAKVEGVVDVAGGLCEWRARVDPTFPL
jgi:adenylyltransferase/sulfurtransferase